MQASGTHASGLIVSLAIVAATAGCGDKSMGPTGPDTTQNFTGLWIGVSRVISCENPAGGCANYPAGHERYLNIRLTQTGDTATGILSVSEGGPLALPAAFWISGRLASGTLTFEPMEVQGASGALTSFSGEVTLTSPSRTEMRGRMTERSAHFGTPLTIAWEVRTARR